MKRVMHYIAGLLILCAVTLSAQGWRGSVGNNEVFFGRVARPQVTDIATLGDATREWLTLYVKNIILGAGGLITAPTVNVTTAYQVSGVPTIAFAAANFTTAASTALQTITGLTFALPANTVLKVPFSCRLTYSMATAAVPMSFGFQTTALTPTNFQGMGQMETALTTVAYGDALVTNTTATTIVTGTPSVITTIWNAYLDGFVENPSGVTTTINVMVATSNAGDLVTVYRDSWCRAF